MTYDATRDLLVDAFRVLFQSNRNAALASELGEGYPAILSTSGKEPNLGSLGNETLPALYVYRAGSRPIYNGKKLILNTTLRAQYILPSTPEEKVEDRVPLLRLVAHGMMDDLDCLLDENGKDIVTPVGGIEIDEMSIVLAYRYYKFASDSYPAFLMSWDLQHYREDKPLDELSGLPWLLELFAKLEPNDFTPSEQPLIAVAARTDEGEQAADATDDPFDDSHVEGYPT